MLISTLLLSMSAAILPSNPTIGPYRVAVESLEGKCYFLADSDVELNARQLYGALRQRDEYDVDLRIDIVTGSGSPERCVKIAMSAIRRAGFTKIVVRPQMSGEWFGPVPPTSEAETVR